MRIISGRFKGRLIKRVKEIRPTQNRVREALFDILGDIQGLSFVDIYAGSGAIGLEALSHAAGRVIFVEISRKCIDVIKTNITLLGLSKHQEDESICGVISLDAHKAIKRLSQRNERLDIVFLDPPYYQDLAKKTLKSIAQYDIVSPAGMIICQHDRREILPQVEGDFNLIKQAKYGSSRLSVYRRPV